MSVFNSIVLILTLNLLYFQANLAQIKPGTNKAVSFSQVLPDSTLKNTVKGGLIFLENAQVKQTSGIEKFEGEWPSYIHLNEKLTFLKKRCFYDSNAFSVIPIQNILAEIYLEYPEYDHIPDMLRKSVRHMMYFKTDSSGTFGFWPYFAKMHTTGKTGKGPDEIHRRMPNHFPLLNRFAKNFTNGVDDADDQTLAIQSIYYYNRVAKLSGMDSIEFELRDTIDDIFNQFRDSGRCNVFLYDRYITKTVDSDAYLTWFGEEYQYKNRDHFYYFFNNLFWFLPFSSLYPGSAKPQIPFSTNDVDVIVNLNIFTTFAHLGMLDSLDGLNGVLKMTKNIVFSNDYDHASKYYNNRYQLHYSLSKAYLADHKKHFETEVKHLINHLKSSQNPDGSWTGRRSWNGGDTIQSTANALMALINFGEFESYQTMENINNAVLFLHNKMISEGETNYWKGGIYFCGGMYLRNILYWHSDCYTTALIVQAMLKYMELFNEN